MNPLVLGLFAVLAAAPAPTRATETIAIRGGTVITVGPQGTIANATGRTSPFPPPRA